MRYPEEPTSQGAHDYYVGCLCFAMEHDFQNREEMISMVTRVACMDMILTPEDYTDILIKAQNAHKVSMEMNFNEGW